MEEPLQSLFKSDPEKQYPQKRRQVLIEGKKGIGMNYHFKAAVMQPYALGQKGSLFDEEADE